MNLYNNFLKKGKGILRNMKHHSVQKNVYVQNTYLIWNNILALIACCIGIILWLSLCKYKQLSFPLLRGIDTNVSMQHTVKVHVIYLCEEHVIVPSTWSNSSLKYVLVHHPNIRTVLDTNNSNTMNITFLEKAIHSHCSHKKTLSQKAIFSLLHQFQSILSLPLKHNHQKPYFFIVDWQKNQNVLEDRLYLSDEVGAFVQLQFKKSLTSYVHLQKTIEILYKFWFFTLLRSESSFDYSVKTNFIFTLASDPNNGQGNWNFTKDIKQTSLQEFLHQLGNTFNFSIFSKIKQSSRLQNLINPFIMSDTKSTNLFFYQNPHKLLNEIQNVFESPEHNWNFRNIANSEKSYHLGVWVMANTLENKLKFCSRGKTLLTRQTLIHPTVGFLVVIPPECIQQNDALITRQFFTEMTQYQIHNVAEFWVAHIRQKLGLQPSKVLRSQILKELKCVKAQSTSPAHKTKEDIEYEIAHCVNSISFSDQTSNQPLHIIAEIPLKKGVCEWELRQLQRFIIDTETNKFIKTFRQLASVRHIFISTYSISQFSRQIQGLIQKLLGVMKKTNMLTADRLNAIQDIQYSFKRIVDSELWLEGIPEPLNYIVGIYTPLVLPCIIIFLMVILSLVKFEGENRKDLWSRWMKKKNLKSTLTY